MLLATASALDAQGGGGGSDRYVMAAEIATLTDPSGPHSQRRFPPYARLLMGSLAGRGGLPIESIPFLAESFLEQTTSRASHISGDRADHEPYGPGDNAAAARVLPVALAYRDAPAEVLERAIDEACVFSHPHPVGMDGARVAAAAVVWLSKQQAGDDEASGPVALLRHLQGVARTEDMKAKLAFVIESLFSLSSVSDYRAFYGGAEWARLIEVTTRLTFHGFATSGTEAVAVALWALVTSWRRPEQAVIVAASFAGSAPVTSQLTGAFCVCGCFLQCM